MYLHQERCVVIDNQNTLHNKKKERENATALHARPHVHPFSISLSQHSGRLAGGDRLLERHGMAWHLIAWAWVT